MSEIRFYHLQRARLEDVLPVILERAYERKNRILVLTGGPERSDHLSSYLWTYAADSFLPHGTAKDGDAQIQPIFLSHEPVNANQADLLILTDGVDYPNPEDFPLICDIFDGNDPRVLHQSREKWKKLKASGHRLVYYLQSDTGKWEEQSRQ